MRHNVDGGQRARRREAAPVIQLFDAGHVGVQLRLREGLSVAHTQAGLELDERHRRVAEI